MFRGNEFSRALTSYWVATQGSNKQLPVTLADLLDDRRGPHPLHHLRRIYTDPFTGQADWVLVKTEDERISGIHSRSDAPALRVVDLPAAADATSVPVSARIFSVAPALPASSAASSTEPAASSAQRIGSWPAISP